MMTNEKSIEKFHDLESWYKELSESGIKWIFRAEKYVDADSGLTTTKQVGAAGGLTTTLEKSFKDIGTSMNGADLTDEDIAKHKRNAEKDIIREFQRRLHLYSNNLPAQPDILQWLSLMQHHKAPTRLLDWTYSFWVAVHFAIQQRVPDSNNDTAKIWAINVKEIVDKNRQAQESIKKNENHQKIHHAINYFNELPYCDPDAIYDNATILFLFDFPQLVVLVAGGFRHNQRLTLQQGTFLIPGDITKSFRKNLEETFDTNDKKYIRSCIIKVTVDSKREVIKELRRMNINNAVLFPGIDGFCESLWTRIGSPMEDKLIVSDKDLILYDYSKTLKNLK